MGDLERIAYESAVWALDKQEKVLEELRARTGILLGASSSPAPRGFRVFAQRPGDL
jgi:hypothetical protein